MIIYKINVIDELNKHGYTNSILRDNNFLSQATLTNLRRGGNIARLRHLAEHAVQL